MGKEWTTQEGQVTYLISMTRRPGYLPALAHLIRCALRFYLCHLYQAFRPDTKLPCIEYITVWYNVQPLFIDADRSGKQCTGIYPAQLVGGRRLPIPQCIGTAPPDAQAAVGVCWYIPAGEDTPAEPPPEGARLPLGSITTGQRPVVSKCALREGRQRERSAQVIPRRSRFGSLLLVDHRLSSLCHFATNEPSANVYLGGKTTLYTIHLRISQ